MLVNGYDIDRKLYNKSWNHKSVTLENVKVGPTLLNVPCTFPLTLSWLPCMCAEACGPTEITGLKCPYQLGCHLNDPSPLKEEDHKPANSLAAL